MSSVQQLSSGTESETRYAMIDEKKKRRMISNRESARRSRMRKQQHMEDLIRESDNLRRGNTDIAKRMDDIMQRHAPLAAENNVLRAQHMELTERFNYLCSVIGSLEKNGGVVTTPFSGGVVQGTANMGCQVSNGFQESGGLLGFGEIDDPLLRPWQSACTSQPIAASAGLFRF